MRFVVHFEGSHDEGHEGAVRFLKLVDGFSAMLTANGFRADFASAHHDDRPPVAPVFAEPATETDAVTSEAVVDYEVVTSPTKSKRGPKKKPTT